MMADLIGVQQAQGTHGAGPDLHVGGNPTTITNLSCSVKNADEQSTLAVGASSSGTC